MYVPIEKVVMEMYVMNTYFVVLNEGVGYNIESTSMCKHMIIVMEIVHFYEI